MNKCKAFEKHIQCNKDAIRMGFCLKHYKQQRKTVNNIINYLNK